MDHPYVSFVVVAVIAFTAPLLRALAPKLLVPAIVLELVGGILVGPDVLDLASVTGPVKVFSQVGLVALLFLAGREIDLRGLTGPVVRRSGLGFAISAAIGVAIGLALNASDLAEDALIVAIILCASSLSVIVVPLRDAGQSRTTFGQQVIAAAAVAEFGAVLLLAFHGSANNEGPGTEILHLVAFGLAALLIAAALRRGERAGRVSRAMAELENTSAQIRVRGDMALLALVVGLGAELGVEAVLAAFAIGLVRGLSDTSERSREKIEAVAMGVFVPFFFVASGMQLDVSELFASFENAVLLPLFLVAILAARGLPALLYRRQMGRDKAAAAALLQATSLSFIIVATQIGTASGLLGDATAAAMVGAGLLSVMIFPAAALGLLRRGEAGARPPAPA